MLLDFNGFIGVFKFTGIVFYVCSETEENLKFIKFTVIYFIFMCPSLRALELIYIHLQYIYMCVCSSRAYTFWCSDLIKDVPSFTHFVSNFLF